VGRVEKMLEHQRGRSLIFMVSSLIYFHVIYVFLMHLFNILDEINLKCEALWKKNLAEFGIVSA